MQACVLYLEPSTRLIGLSLRSFLVQAGAGTDPPLPAVDRVGEVVKECKMTAMHHMSGAMFKLADKTPAFAHVSKAGALRGNCLYIFIFYSHKQDFCTILNNVKVCI